MRETIATEALNLEDAHYFLTLEEARLDRAAAQHRRRLTNRPRIGSDTVLGKFIDACRLYDLQSDLASSSTSGDASLKPLLSAFAAPSSREWWPADSDVRGVADGLCKLQRVCDVTVARMVAMISRRLPYVSSQDLSVIARGCYANATHGNTTAWSQQALAAALYAQGSPRNLQVGLWWLQANDARRAAMKSKHRHVYPAPPETDVNEYKSPGSGIFQHPFLSSLGSRISLASGLSLESSEPYQVANYGLGGHYTPHDDALDFEQTADEWGTRDGNRVATMLLYLTDVSRGGATAFVHLQLAVKPRRGSALFWYDLAPYSGNDGPVHFSFWHQKRAVQKLTTHVGCPVLWGTKWIATKWIRERQQCRGPLRLPWVTECLFRVHH
ncbi:hypothetical protein MTO96_044886 [Rhipicephalus appendiculatus]